MNGAHLHLILTHGPVLGLVFGTILLGYAWWRGGEEVRRLALVFTAVGGLLALPAYFTGEDAEDIVEGLPGVSKSVIHEHEEAAEGAAIAAVVTAVLALGGFALALRQGATPRWAVAGVAVAGTVASVWLGVTAYRGGSIRHPEMDQAAPAPGAERHDRD